MTFYFRSPHNAGEYESLNAIHNAVPSLCPAAQSHGVMAESPDTHYLITDFLELHSSASSSSSEPRSLASKLAELHSTPAPSDGKFGFPVTTCCGNTPQNNSYKSSWAEFYGENRLREIARQCEKKNGKDKELGGLVERTVEEVVPRLLGKMEEMGEVKPVVVHGDLWSGNHGTAGGEEVVFDPSVGYRWLSCVRINADRDY